MSELPTLDKARETAKSKAKTLVPWLSDPLTCPECGKYMDATRVYDPQQAAFYPMGEAPAWTCDECDVQLRRE